LCGAWDLELMVFAKDESRRVHLHCKAWCNACMFGDMLVLRKVTMQVTRGLARLTKYSVCS
jgi:hypothetical protein